MRLVKVKQMLKRLEDFLGRNGDLLIFIAAISTFINLSAVPAVTNTVTTVGLLMKKTRNEIFSYKVFRLCLFSIPVFILGAIFFKNYLGLVIGVWQWYMLFFLLFACTVITKKSYGNLIDLIIILSVPVGIYAIVEKIISLVSNNHLYRVQSTFYNPNYYAFIIEIVIISIIYRCVMDFKKYYVAVLVLNLICLCLTGCRSAIFAISIAAVCSVILYCKNDKKVILLSCIGIGMVIVFFIFVNALTKRFSIEMLTENLSLRVSIWKVALSYIKKRPIIGYGSMAMQKITQSGVYLEENPVPHAHNLVLGILLDYGILGFAFLCILIFIAARIMYRAYNRGEFEKKTVIYYISLFLMLILHGTFDFMIFGTQTFVLPVIISSGLGLLRSENGKERDNRT